MDWSFLAGLGVGLSVGLGIALRLMAARDPVPGARWFPRGGPGGTEPQSAGQRATGREVAMVGGRGCGDEALPAQEQGRARA